jgi:anti-anti-sigma regulatory factor
LQDLEGHTEPLLTSHPGREILLAWTAPQVVSSTFPGRLVPWNQVAGATGAELKLCAPQPIVQHSFHLRRLDRRFSNVPTRSAGLDSFAPTA